MCYPKIENLLFKLFSLWMTHTMFNQEILVSLNNNTSSNSLVVWGKCRHSVIIVVMLCKRYCLKDINASALNFRCYNFIILCMRDFHNVAITIKFISKIFVLTYVWFTYLVILVALQQYLYLLKTMTDLDTRLRSAFTLRLTNYLEEYMSAKNRW